MNGSSVRRNVVVLLQVLGVAAVAAGCLAVTTMVAVMIGGAGASSSDAPYVTTDVSSPMPDVSFLDGPGTGNEALTSDDPQVRADARRGGGASARDATRPKRRNALDLGGPTEILHDAPTPLTSPPVDPPMPDEEGLVVEIIEDVGGITNGLVTGPTP